MARRIYPILWFLAALTLAGGASAEESLRYVAEVRSAVTLWSWAEVGEATVTTTRGVPCPGGGQCDETRVWITSEGETDGRALGLESANPVACVGDGIPDDPVAPCQLEHGSS